MAHQVAVWITNLADTGVILPLSILLAITLWCLESVRSAWMFARSLIALLIVMTILKVVFISCGQVIGAGIISPSGHSSLAGFFYGALGILLWSKLKDWRGIVAGALMSLLVVAIAISRYLLDAHNIQEILVGTSMGILALCLFAHPYLRQPHQDLNLGRMGLVLIPVFALTYGTVLPAEHVLRQMIPYFRLGLCVA